MNKTRQMFIDHYLQAALLAKLTASNTSLRFSELKDEGIDNGLFMYHAKKLIARGAIEKTNEGFHLTPNGARWVNAIAPDMGYSKPTPRPLIQIVATRGDNLLLSSRKGQLKTLLNDYTLPGGLHKLGFSADESATRIAAQWFGKAAISPEFLAVVETIATYPDGFTHHSLSHIFKVELPGAILLPQEDSRFEFHWVPMGAIYANDERFARSQFIPLFMKKVQSGTLATREVIRIDNM